MLSNIIVIHQIILLCTATFFTLLGLKSSQSRSSGWYVQLGAVATAALGHSEFVLAKLLCIKECLKIASLLLISLVIFPHWYFHGTSKLVDIIDSREILCCFHQMILKLCKEKLVLSSQAFPLQAAEQSTEQNKTSENQEVKQCLIQEGQKLSVKDEFKTFVNLPNLSRQCYV